MKYLVVRDIYVLIYIHIFQNKVNLPDFLLGFLIPLGRAGRVPVLLASISLPTPSPREELSSGRYALASTKPVVGGSCTRSGSLAPLSVGVTFIARWQAGGIAAPSLAPDDEWWMGRFGGGLLAFDCVTDQDWLRLAISALTRFARADSHAYSKMDLLRKHLPREDMITPRRARFAGLLFLTERKEGREEGMKEGGKKVYTTNNSREEGKRAVGGGEGISIFVGSVGRETKLSQREREVSELFRS